MCTKVLYDNFLENSKETKNYAWVAVDFPWDKKMLETNIVYIKVPIDISWDQEPCETSIVPIDTSWDQEPCETSKAPIDTSWDQEPCQTYPAEVYVLNHLIIRKPPSNLFKTQKKMFRAENGKDL